MKVIAFHLPQFHEIPENNEWWGKGFTEWTNTTKAKPLWKGHYQPREPLNRNYYNLLDPRARQWQATIASTYGVYGFCYYHYWFNGRLLLQKPVEEIVHTGEPKFPFCLAWANEPWTRNWDGGSSEVLMAQEYGGESDWEEHFNYLLPIFQDPRYIKVGGKPLFLIYRAGSVDNCKDMLSFWQKLARSHSFDGIYFAEMKTSFGFSDSPEFAASVEFEPMYTLYHDRDVRYRLISHLRNYLKRLSRRFPIESNMLVDKANYDWLWRRILARGLESTTGKKTFLGGFVDWDNTARKGRNGLVIDGSTPDKFRGYMEQQLIRANEMNSEFVFINAWNEWAEGTYLEPDQEYGYRYLQALRDAINAVESGT